jgi:hypothetical protein
MNKIYVSTFVFLLALFTACDMTDPESKASGEKAIVHISIDNRTQERTVRPSLQDWKLWGAVQGEDETLLAEFSSAGGTMTLETGVWNFTLKGYKGTALILTGNIAEQVIDQGTNYLRFTVVLAASAEGEGTIALTVELPAASGITEARVFKDEELYTSIEPVDNKVVFEESTFNAGSYYFSIRLYKDETLYGVVSETVLVWADLRSEKTYTLANTDLNLTYTITYHFGDDETETDYYQYTDADKTLLSPPTSYPDRVFMGWCENADFSGNAVFTIPNGSTTGDKDFYAWWAEVVDTPSDLSLAESLAWIKSQTQGGAYSITLKADEVLAPTALSYSVNNVSITIDGGTAERVISLDSTGSLFSVGSGVTLTLGNNVTLQGRSDNTTSLVWVSSGGTLVMNAGSKISGNTATAPSGNASGGGVYVYSSGRFTMSGGEVSNNTASNGGGVYVSSSGTFTMSGGEVSGNTAPSGGGVYAYNGATVTMTRGAISGNTASNGGGVYVYSRGTFTMSGGEISGNTASNGGGVCVDYSGTFTMSGGEITGNTAATSGGGVSNSGTFEMSDGEISGNTASNGGGVAGSLMMSGGEVSNNTASNGGGVYVSSSGTFTMSGGEVSDNTTSNGGGVYVYSRGTFTMSGGEISGNTASNGGGVYVYQNGTFTKQSDGIVYGSDASEGLKNTATNGDDYGHAVYVYISSSSNRKRNATAGVGITLDSTVSGADGGWETRGSIQITPSLADDLQLSNVSLFTNQSVVFNTETNYTSCTWYWNDEPISNATSSTYTLTPDKSKTPGIYELSVVIITNAGETLSARCRVTVMAH